MEPSAFLQLPGEIRNQVYGQALTEREDIDISTAAAPLTSAGSHIRRESLGIYYSRNTFKATIFESIVLCFADIKSWLESVVGPHCSQLRKLTIVVAAPEGLESVSWYREGCNPWAWLERALDEAGCSDKLVCQVSFESLASAEPHLRPQLNDTPRLQDCVSEQMVESLRSNFDGILDNSAGTLANFEPIPLHELGIMSRRAKQWLHDQLSEFSEIIQESRALLMEFAGLQAQALTMGLEGVNDDDEGM